MASWDVYRCASLIYLRYFRTPNLYSMSGTLGCNKMFLTHVVLWTRLRVSFNACVYIPSDLLGVNLTINDRMILYYCLTTKAERS
jgi:hypothetical protein